MQQPLTSVCFIDILSDRPIDDGASCGGEEPGQSRDAAILIIGSQYLSIQSSDADTSTRQKNAMNRWKLFKKLNKIILKS